jgi:hypothetical protein
MHNFFLAMVLACCNQLLRQRPIGSGVHGCGKMLLGVSMDGAHNSTHSSCKGNGPGAGLLANLLVVSAISVWKPDPDTNEMLPNQPQPLVGASHTLWCYHRLWNIILDLSPLRELISDVSLSPARVVLYGGIIDSSMVSSIYHH